MHDEMITLVTKRGQTSVPAKLRRRAGLRSGKRLHWYPVSDQEFRVVVESSEEAPGPLAVLGWAKRYNRDPLPSSDEALQELREGEHA
jgi:bifunctional DNA-binding transcriptional regulator/antitoxin component of YhaV-PrlF toxin-antitoxin module